MSHHIRHTEKNAAHYTLSSKPRLINRLSRLSRNASTASYTDIYTFNKIENNSPLLTTLTSGKGRPVFGCSVLNCDVCFIVHTMVYFIVHTNISMWFCRNLEVVSWKIVMPRACFSANLICKDFIRNDHSNQLWPQIKLQFLHIYII